MVNKMNWMNTSQFVLFNCWTHLCQSWQERCSSCCKPLQHTTVSFLRLTRLPSPFDHLTICLTVNSHFSSRYWNQTACESFSKCTKRFELSHKSITFHGETLCLLAKYLRSLAKLMCLPNFTLHSPPHHLITFPSQMFCELAQSFSRGHILQEIHLRDIIFSSHLNFLTITMTL